MFPGKMSSIYPSWSFCSTGKFWSMKHKIGGARVSTGFCAVFDDSPIKIGFHPGADISFYEPELCSSDPVSVTIIFFFSLVSFRSDSSSGLFPLPWSLRFGVCSTISSRNTIPNYLSRHGGLCSIFSRYSWLFHPP